MAYCTFQLKTDGTGGNIGSAIQLGKDETLATTPVASAVFPIADDTLRKVQVQTHFFATGANDDVRRRRCVEYLEALKVACRFKPVEVRTLARGAAFIPNIHQNFGKLVQIGTTTGDLLDNCCLLEATILSDDGIAGFTIGLTFGRVSDTQWPSGMSGIAASPTP